MKDLRGKVAVVTGAASGIGLALSERFAAEGMKVVLADIEQEALDRAVGKLREMSEDALGVVTDVSRAKDVDALAEKTLEAFGAVHVVCNNAGVMKGGISWEAPLEDYAWHLAVNLWGVIHGIRSFVPIMLEREVEGHVVNTSSQCGLMCGPYSAAYTASKHAVVALSECLYHELSLSGSKVGVSVLLPTGVNTEIMASERNRPDRFRPGDAANSEIADIVAAAAADQFKRGMAPGAVAEQVVDAIREERFYIFTKGGESALWKTIIDRRFDEIRDFRNPSLPVPDDMTAMLSSDQPEAT
jgi:NAD(P)-dependent dehydrogenase (short-subunit alcohol dehydrogenase family)